MNQKEISLIEIEVKGGGERVQNKVKVDKGMVVKEMKQGQNSVKLLNLKRNLFMGKHVTINQVTDISSKTITR